MGTDSDIPYRDRRDIERQAEQLLRSEFGDDDAFGVARKRHIPVTLIRFDDSQIAGVLDRTGPQPVILVNADDPYPRQNFTVAHELGHFILHPVRSWTDTTATMYRRESWRGDTTTKRAEYQANIFAAALLMPERYVRERWGLLRSPNYLAPFFRVSKKALMRRLEELGLVVPSVEGFLYADLTPMLAMQDPPAPPRLSDESGPIPSFPPIAVDEHGRIIPMSQGERDARQAAFHRVLKLVDRLHDTGMPDASGSGGQRLSEVGPAFDQSVE